MGYASQVTISLTGSPDDVHLILNTYEMSETDAQVKEAWHILGNPDTFEFFAEELRSDHGDLTLMLCWKFDWVKFYDASASAVNRLGEIVNTMFRDHNILTQLKYRRMGEDHDDYEEETWGEHGVVYDDAVHIQRYLTVEMPKADPKEFRANKTVKHGKVLSPTTEE